MKWDKKTEENVLELLKELLNFQTEKNDSMENIEKNLQFYLMAGKQEKEILNQLKKYL